jgi:hypothetical protein
MGLFCDFFCRNLFQVAHPIAYANSGAPIHLLMAYLLSLPITIPSDPPEAGIFGTILGINVSSRPVLTRLKSLWRYVDTYIRRIAR